MTPYIRMRMANKARGEFRVEDDTLWLYDAIAGDDEETEFWGGVSPRTFISALRSMSGPVTLRINSPGGSVFGAQAMVVAMREYEHPITARIDSLAASAASVIASEAAEVEMAEGAMLMIHKAWGLTVGNADEMLKQAAILEKIDGQIAATYARRSEGDADSFLTMMAAETWFTAEEAVAMGLADRVLAGSKQRPKALWDLSAYAKAPRLPDPPEPANDMQPMLARRLAARMAVNRI